MPVVLPSESSRNIAVPQLGHSPMKPTPPPGGVSWRSGLRLPSPGPNQQFGTFQRYVTFRTAAATLLLAVAGVAVAPAVAAAVRWPVPAVVDSKAARGLAAADR